GLGKDVLAGRLAAVRQVIDKIAACRSNAMEVGVHPDEAMIASGIDWQRLLEVEMWPRTDLIDLLGITHPIIQAPMSGFSAPALVAAVSNAGALGSIGCATLPTQT